MLVADFANLRMGDQEVASGRHVPRIICCVLNRFMRLASGRKAMVELSYST